ncbi:ATP-binding cassette domain-containing protein [Jiangella aurantiaca]|uniref:ATP-binding cassette domain-containing protein n=1 Tax=Jiangella aurantiaca TaxID=2530373 RepID=A0A4R5A1U4_9ACTN|nr:ATP-binding cassette domain-containing protein [Jiangella aurantiaca]TDD65395.1 ATP-binding cassette domain-containing protein [Jiangella aurantiaca]
MLAVESLRFSYRRRDSGDELFDGLTHQFTPGAVTAVRGASGRGKSTLLYLLGLLLTPRAGSVTIAGERVDALPDVRRSEIRATMVGFVFQAAELNPRRSVLDSVTEPAIYAGHALGPVRERARALLEAFGVGERADHRPGEISGGQAQRVALTRALVCDPAIILADEPTGNLDRDNARIVIDALRVTAHGEHSAGGTDRLGESHLRTVVIATHDPFVVDHADEVLDL